MGAAYARCDVGVFGLRPARIFGCLDGQADCAHFCAHPRSKSIAICSRREGKESPVLMRKINMVVNRRNWSQSAC